VRLIGRPRTGFSANSVTIFLLNVAVFTPFNERGVTVNEFPDRNIALNKTVTSNVLTNSALYLTDTSTDGAYFEGTNDVSDVRVLIDLGSEFSIGDIMITGYLPDPEGGYPPGYNQIIAVELLDTNLEVNWRSEDYINGTYDTVDDWSDAWKFAFSVRTPGVQNVTFSEFNTDLDALATALDGRVTALEDADPTDLGPLDGRVTALEDADPTDLGLLDGRMTALEDAAPTDLGPLDRRVTALEDAAPTDLGPLDARVGDNSAAIESIENQLIITSASGEFLDPNLYVVTRSSPWYENNVDYGVYKLFDGDESTVTAFIKDMSGVNGVAFAEFEMGEVVRVSGFRMKPRNSYKDRFPRDTRLFSGTSTTGPWT